ncbi:MAG: recombination protein RecR [Rickettsiales bacterium TMED254]|nr:recombination protein RecR [Rickettsiales bacterium]RPF77893.1 MAG: recombination protein RecR [Rickettsiales bacterium TMED254]
MSSSLEELINIFEKLPGLGPRSARRLVFYLLKNKEKVIPQLSNTLSKVKEELMDCSDCGNVDIQSPCNICSDIKRITNKICVVESIADLWAIERSKSFNGKYHVLGGFLSAIDGIGPEQLNIKGLIEKCNKNLVEEIILATNATVEGQLTAQFIAEQFIGKNILITRLAQGMPLGSELDYIDQGTLSTAFNSRNDFK